MPAIPVIRQYSAYGLDLESSSEIHGLTSYLPDSNSPILKDVPLIKLTTGARPDWAESAVQLPPRLLYAAKQQDAAGAPVFQLESLGSEEFFRLSYADGTQFLIDHGTQKLWASCPSTVTPEDLATYLLGPVMGFVLRRRGVLALHASCFCIGRKAIAICGPPSAGKSTAAAALALRGFPILCEDIAALRERHGVFGVSPGYPRVNLWPDSAISLFGTSSSLPRITPNWDKRFLPLDGSLASFENQELPLTAVYTLDPHSDSPDLPRIEDVSPQNAALLLVQNTYMNYLLDKSQRAEELDAIARLVFRVPVRRLLRDGNPAKISAMCELVEKDAAAIVGASHESSASHS